MTAYDKAKYHYNADFPEELPKLQAGVHCGFFLGWIIEQGFCSKTFAEDFHDDIKAFKQRKRTGPQLFMRIGGVFASDMLSDEGNAFTESYYNDYMMDYLFFLELEDDVKSAYHVPDTWDNYYRIAERLTDEYEYWLNKSREESQ